MSKKPGGGGSSCDQEFLTVKEVADRLRCHPRTIRNRINAGIIQAVRLEASGYWLVPEGEYYRHKARLLEGARK